MKKLAYPLKQLDERGFTIFETFTSIALLCFLTIVIFGAIKLSRIVFDQSLINIDVHGNLKRTIGVMARDMEEAKQGIPNSSDMASCDIDDPSNVCIQAAAVSFKVPEKTSLADVTSYKTIKYTFDSDAKTISRQEISSTGTAGSSLLMGRNITSISFVTDTDLNMIAVTLSGAKSGSKTTSVTTQVFLRNKS